MGALYFCPKQKRVVLRGARRYNPRRLAWVVWAGALAGYRPGFLTLTARHTPTALRARPDLPPPDLPPASTPSRSDPGEGFSFSDEEKRRWNRRISRALYDFLTRTLPEETGKRFEHFLLRSEEHESGHFHYHLLIVDWPFSPDDWGKIRLAWVRALHRYSLVSDEELQAARDYAARWQYRDTVARDVYRLGQKFGGFAKFEPLAKEDAKDLLSSLPRVAAYVAGYIGDEGGGRMRGYGVFRNLVHMHTVLVFLQRHNFPQPDLSAPSEVWADWWDNIFVPTVRQLVSLRLQAKNDDPAEEIFRLLVRIARKRLRFRPPKGKAFLRAIREGTQDGKILLCRWLYFRRLTAEQREQIANRIGAGLLLQVAEKVRTKAKKRADQTYTALLVQGEDPAVASARASAVFAREAKKIFSRARDFLGYIYDFLRRRVPFSLFLPLHAEECSTPKSIRLVWSPIVQALAETVADLLGQKANFEPPPLPDPEETISPCPRLPRYTGIIGFVLSGWEKTIYAFVVEQTEKYEFTLAAAEIVPAV